MANIELIEGQMESLFRQLEECEAACEEGELVSALVLLDPEFADEVLDDPGADGPPDPPPPPPEGPMCGNGVLEAGEECDGTDFGGQQCTDFDDFTGGSLSCTAQCTIDTSACTVPPPPEEEPDLVADPTFLSKLHLRGEDECDDPFESVQLTNEGGGEIDFRTPGPLPEWLDVDPQSGPVPGATQPAFNCMVPAGDLDLQHDLVIQGVDRSTGEDVGEPAIVTIELQVRDP